MTDKKKARRPTVRVAKVDDFAQDDENANLGTDRGREAIGESFRRYGAARSVVVDKHGRLIGGNKSQAAALEAGIDRALVVETEGDELVVVRRTDLDLDSEDGKARALAIADNRTAELDLEWNTETMVELFDRMPGDLDYLFSDREMKALRSSLAGEGDLVDPEPKIDQAKQLAQKWGTETGQLWKVGRHRLLCGDSTSEADVTRVLDKATPNLMVTDPPYGVEYDANWRNEAADKGLISYADCRVGNVQNDDRVDWSEAWALFPGDVIYCWHAGQRASEVQASLEGAGFQIRCQLIWRKQAPVISRGHYHGRHEPCWYAVRKGQTALWIGDRSQNTCWDIQWDQNVAGGHSTQKPLECMARPIRNHDGDVYDPFIGSGTAMVAAEQLDRTCYGIDIDPGYVAVCLERMLALGVEGRLEE